MIRLTGKMLRLCTVACCAAIHCIASAQYIDTCEVGTDRVYTVIGGQENSVYEWSIDDELVDETGIDVSYQWTEAGVFNIAVTEINIYGCTGKTYTYLILVSDEIDDYEIQVPNVFTPNGDGLNDYFYVIARNIDSYELKIFNRWGSLLYSSTELSDKWNGKHNGKKCASGVYFYTVEYTKNGKTRKENGFFHLFE